MIVATDLDQIRDDFLLNALQFPLVFLLIGRRASAIIQKERTATKSFPSASGKKLSPGSMKSPPKRTAAETN